MRVFAGLATLVILGSVAFGTHQHPRAEPECPVPEPGEVLNITFYPNEEDCTKYWECDNGNLYNGSCPDDLVWNPNVDSCDWPFNYDCPYESLQIRSVRMPVDIPECPVPEPGEVFNITFYPNEEDCTKYWECDNGNLYNGSCPDDLVWNPNVDSCDWPFNYDCPYKSLQIRSVRMPMDIPECPVPEPGEVLNITFYPNDEDCHKYWECDNGNLYNGSCPDDLVWNPNVDSCDWPFNYECRTEKGEPVVRPGIPSSVADVVCPPPSADGNVNVTFFPNEDDCHRYWECDNGELLEGDCGTLVWNPQVNNCDWDYNYPCNTDNGSGDDQPDNPTTTEVATESAIRINKESISRP